MNKRKKNMEEERRNYKSMNKIMLNIILIEIKSDDFDI